MIKLGQQFFRQNCLFSKILLSFDYSGILSANQDYSLMLSLLIARISHLEIAHLTENTLLNLNLKIYMKLQL